MKKLPRDRRRLGRVPCSQCSELFVPTRNERTVCPRCRHAAHGSALLSVVIELYRDNRRVRR
jgi:hypothetical protein